MSVSYNKLWKLLIDKKISKTELTHMAGISTNAMAKLGKDEDVRMIVLEKICSALNCRIEDVVEIQNCNDTMTDNIRNPLENTAFRDTGLSI